jgi:CBS domain-containing protein
MAAAGPATSLAIGGLAWLGSAVLGTPPRDTFAQVANAVLDSLAYINTAVAVFNLIPGFPLDGGRVLRATIWGITKRQGTSTRIAARGGQIVAGLFALGGAYLVLGLGESGGLWWGLIAYVLFGAATQTLQQQKVTSMIGNARVAQVMTTELVTVPRGTSIGTAVRDHLLPRNLRAIAVVDGARFTGLVTIGDLRKVEQDVWPSTAVDAVMTPASEISAVEPNELLVGALDKFGPDLPLLPVVEGGELRGLLYREAVLGYVRMREMLGVDPDR